jgi:hypothetical protein
VTRRFFERLPQPLERRAAELRQLVEEQHAVVRERDLAGPRLLAAAEQARRAARVVWCTERALEADVDRCRTCDRRADRESCGGVAHREDRTGLVLRRRRQEVGQPARECGLAAARGAHQEQVVASCRSDDEGALGGPQAAQVGELERWSRRACRGVRCTRFDVHRPAQERDRGREVADRNRSHLAHERSPRRFLRGAQDRVQSRFGRTSGEDERAACRADAPAHREFSERSDPLESFAVEEATRSGERERHRKIEVCADLAQAGG